MAKVFNLKSYVISILRRASYRNANRSVALNRAKLSRNTYKCNQCKKLVPRKLISIDHVQPVVPITGWVSWDSFIERLFCSVEGLQALCKPCHKDKTKQENTERRANAKGKNV